MPGKNIAEVRVAVDGIVSLALFGTAGPTTVSSTLDVAFKDYGYVSDDGVTESTSVSSEKIRAWQKGKVVRSTVTESDVTFQLVLIQTSAETVALYYNGVVQSDGSILQDPSKDRPVLALVIDILDGAERIRKYAPEAQVTEVGDQVFVNGEPIGYEVTITANFNEVMGGSVKHWFSTIATPAIPTITAVTPAAATTGSIVTIRGSRFTGVVGVASVKFGATNATQYIVDSDDTIYATMPAGAAGAANVTVINATGTSLAFTYTRGA